MILDIAPTELLVLGAVALVVIPPKDLPRAMRFAGQWIGKARGMARQFRSGFDDMIREAEFAEMEKKWKAENERIMREFPQTVDMPQLTGPVPDDNPAELDPNPVMTAMPAVDAVPVVAPAKPKPKSRAKPAAAKSAAGKTTAKKPASKPKAQTARKTAKS